MSDTADDLDEPRPPRVGSRKVGPFTLQQWGLVVGSGLVIGLYLRHRNAGQPADLLPSLADTGTSSTGGTYVPVGAGAGSGGSTAAPSTPTGGPTTNLEWQTRATEALVAQGQDPSLVHDALSKFLNGEPVTPQERALIAMAIRAWGEPPEGAPSIVAADVVTTPTVPGPSAGPTSSASPPPSTPAGPVSTLTPEQSAQAAQWFTAYHDVVAQANAGGELKSLFPKFIYLGITADDPNLSPTVSGWYANYLTATKRTDLLHHTN